MHAFLYAYIDSSLPDFQLYHSTDRSCQTAFQRNLSFPHLRILPHKLCQIASYDVLTAHDLCLCDELLIDVHDVDDDADDDRDRRDDFDDATTHVLLNVSPSDLYGPSFLDTLEAQSHVGAGSTPQDLHVVLHSTLVQHEHVHTVREDDLQDEAVLADYTDPGVPP